MTVSDRDILFFELWLALRSIAKSRGRQLYLSQQMANSQELPLFFLAVECRQSLLLLLGEGETSAKLRHRLSELPCINMGIGYMELLEKRHLFRN